MIMLFITGKTIKATIALLRRRDPVPVPVLTAEHRNKITGSSGMLILLTRSTERRMEIGPCATLQPSGSFTKILISSSLVRMEELVTPKQQSGVMDRLISKKRLFNWMKMSISLFTAPMATHSHTAATAPVIFHRSLIVQSGASGGRTR